MQVSSASKELIINKEKPEKKVEWFAPGDVIGLDIFVSTGEGKSKKGYYKTTVFNEKISRSKNLELTADICNLLAN